MINKEKFMEIMNQTFNTGLTEDNIDVTVVHQRTCPECGRKLVNLYKRGNVWKCRRCQEEAIKNEGD